MPREPACCGAAGRGEDEPPPGDAFEGWLGAGGFALAADGCGPPLGRWPLCCPGAFAPCEAFWLGPLGAAAPEPAWGDAFPAGRDAGEPVGFWAGRLGPLDPPCCHDPAPGGVAAGRDPP